MKHSKKELPWAMKQANSWWINQNQFKRNNWINESASTILKLPTEALLSPWNVSRTNIAPTAKPITLSMSDVQYLHCSSSPLTPANKITLK